jgi:hypothetical protein
MKHNSGKEEEQSYKNNSVHVSSDKKSVSVMKEGKGIVEKHYYSKGMEFGQNLEGNEWAQITDSEDDEESDLLGDGLSKVGARAGGSIP